MQFKPFLLDMWLDSHEPDIEYNLAASTGPSWTLDQLLALGSEEERDRFARHRLSYGRPAGDENLRAAIAQMQGVDPECVQIVTGASEALLVLMWLAAEPGANVVLPDPGFTTFSALPEALGIETRFYHLRRENKFRIDIQEIKKLVDAHTKLVLVNNPHNPTGATLTDEEFNELHAFTSDRGVQLVSDEVYHPVYHGRETRSAARLPQATVIHDLSKAFPLPGLRVGWMIEHNPRRREQYWTARAYFTVSNASATEILATIAMRNHDVVLKRTRQAASRNLDLLDRFMDEHSDALAWVRPQGGMTAFPWLTSGEDTRPFCEAAVKRGILLAPGDCFGMPSYFRLGFGAAEDRFPKGLERLGQLLHSRASRKEVAV
ncbi:MAG TPA: aminotransferase class I/II-fold pyridoxal phosphate-dependent enzyme [Verrucomicrobiae bacterium]|jgi:aspartate/methionine/tyrosine aminotransferase|nr:aminotransferase class I/II-fold pyridoxal phosphate-dependent enzyme [Verrucomicrobiae bacterium]